MVSHDSTAVPQELYWSESLAYVRWSDEHPEAQQARDRDDLVSGLVSAGYTRMPIVEEAGEIAVRGGIVDLFPPHARFPLRVEFFGDDIDGIREFDPASQRSQSKVVHAVAPPPREIILEREALVERGDIIRAQAEKLGTPPSETSEILASI